MTPNIFGNVEPAFGTGTYKLVGGSVPAASVVVGSNLVVTGLNTIVAFLPVGETTANVTGFTLSGGTATVTVATAAVTIEWMALGY